MAEKIKISVIITVLNEAKTIERLLSALEKQTDLPDEVVIVDGGSTDQTRAIVENFSERHPELDIHLSQKQANRSVGRNAAISMTKYESIAITAAACMPDT